MFNVNEVTSEMEENAANGGLIPEGEHNFVIENSRLADNKMLNGKYIEITCLKEGSKQKCWKYFNIIHVSQNAVNIAKVELKKLLNALKIEQITCAEDLKEKCFRGKVEHVIDANKKKQCNIVAFGEYKWEGSSNVNVTENTDDVPF